MPTRAAPCRAGLAIGAVLQLAIILPAAAQQSAPPRLGLDDAVHAALEANVDIELGRRQLDIARAEVIRARGVFDTGVRSAIGQVQTEQRVFDASEGGIAEDPISSRTSNYEVGLTRELAWGVTVQPTVTVSRIDDPLVWSAPFARAESKLGMTVALGHNRWGRITRSAERVARIGEEASAHQLRHVVGSNVQEVVAAYWGYRAAHERLEVYRTSEARANRLLEETRTLVEAEERPAADLNQVQANVASKRMSRLGAEQSLEVARQRLGLAMGLGAGAIRELPPPSDGFPAAHAFHADGPTLERLTGSALEQRPELAIAAQQWLSARALRDAARAATRPRLDLSIALGYAGLTTAADFGGSFSPLFNDIRGVNGTVRLSYQASLANRQALGQELQRAAAVEQQRLSRDHQIERVVSGVALAAAALERSLSVLEEAEAAVRLYHAAVDNEKRKFELGVATLFDVIITEDNLTNALLGGVEGRLGHALALSSLRYETGTLVEGDELEPRFVAAAALTPP